MDEFRLHKRKVLINLLIFIALTVLIIFLVINNATNLKKQWASIALLLVVVAQVPMFVSTVMIIINLINDFEKEKKSNAVLQEAELENYEKEVEEKVKQADELNFSLNKFNKDIGSNQNWETFAEKLLIAISKQLEILVGVVYQLNQEEENFEAVATYAYYSEKEPSKFKVGEGLLGQVVKDNKAMFLSEIPEGYIHIISGLGEEEPNYLAFIPISKAEKVVGIVEIASFKSFGKSFEQRINEISENFGNLAPNFEKTIINKENE